MKKKLADRWQCLHERTLITITLQTCKRIICLIMIELLDQQIFRLPLQIKVLEVFTPTIAHPAKMCFFKILNPSVGCVNTLFNAKPKCYVCVHIISNVKPKCYKC